MNTKKAYIKLDGSVGEKEQPGVEFIDNGYDDNINKQIAEIQKLLSTKKTDPLKPDIPQQ